MTNKPIIGVIPDYNNGSEKSYSARPHYAIRENYINMISDSNAAAIIIPYDKSSTESYISMIDGLLVVGGFFDINPKRYGEEIVNNTVILNEKRGNFEFDFVEKFLKTNKPIFGICNGMQVINVVRGGSLIQDIPVEKENYMIHEQSKIKGKEDSAIGYHQVKINKNSILHKIVQEDEITTNSSHHQAVRKAGKNLEITAYATDGIIEAIEDKSHNFCVGVQWHPEFYVSQADQKLFSAFTQACKKQKP